MKKSFTKNGRNRGNRHNFLTYVHQLAIETAQNGKKLKENRYFSNFLLFQLNRQEKMKEFKKFHQKFLNGQKI